MSQTALGELQFGHLFHGTNTDIHDAVKPPAATGASMAHRWERDDIPQEQHAFATAKDSVAWRFATSASDRSGRARVYEVAPAADQRPGYENAKHPDFAGKFDHAEYASRIGFKVVGRQDIMPPEYGEKTGRQGTLPLDWHPFDNSRKGLASSPNPNHINHPDMQAQARERHTIASKDAAHAEAELNAAQFGRSSTPHKQEGLW